MRPGDAYVRFSSRFIFGSDNGLSPIRRQSITWSNADLLSNGPAGTNQRGILIEIQTFPLKKMHIKIVSKMNKNLVFVFQSSATLNWRDFMMTLSNGNIFRVTGPLCGEFIGDRWITGEFPSQRPVTRMFYLICVWTNGWINNRDAGDLRRHRPH